MKRYSALICGLLLAALLPRLAPAASSVLVWPIYQTIAADRQGSALWLENRGNQPVNLQVRLLAWQQQDGRERYADQQAVIASPPFARVQPGERQLIRLIRTAAVPAGQEQAYRIIIDEVPGLLPAGMQQHAGLQLQMRYLLPLFLQGAGIRTPAAGERPASSGLSAPQLSWQLVRRDGKAWLQLRNQGVVHARLSNVFWGSSKDPARASLQLAAGFLGYVLPGQQMAFPLAQKQSAPAGQTLWAQLADNTPPVAIEAAR